MGTMDRTEGAGKAHMGEIGHFPLGSNNEMIHHTGPYFPLEEAMESP